MIEKGKDPAQLIYKPNISSEDDEYILPFDHYEAPTE